MEIDMKENLLCFRVMTIDLRKGFFFYSCRNRNFKVFICYTEGEERVNKQYITNFIIKKNFFFVFIF